MNEADRRNLHIVLLQMLRAKRDLGRLEDALLNDARMQGHDIVLSQLQEELRDLAARLLIDPMDSELTGKRWVITPLGESKLRQANL